MAQTKIKVSMIDGIEAYLADTRYTSTDVASASTCDIGAATTPRVRITGTTTITSLGTDINTLRFVLFAGALILTHNATTLILPGGANITTVAGDTAIFASDGSGNWRCLTYQRSSSMPLLESALGSTVQAYDVDTAKLDVAQSWTRPQLADTTALTHNTGWDGTTIQHATVTVNGSSFTIANPTSSTNKAIYMIYISYTTSHSVSWGANFKGVSSITPTATAGAKDIFCFRSTGTNLELVGYSLNAGA